MQSRVRERNLFLITDGFDEILYMHDTGSGLYSKIYSLIASLNFK